MRKSILFILVLIQVSVFGQIYSGICSGKVIIDDEYKKEEMNLFVYTGSDSVESWLDTLYFKFSEETNKLIYLGYKSDLDSLDLDSEEFENIVYVEDTSKTNEYIEESFETWELIKKNGEKWIEVLCDADIPKYLVRIQQNLRLKKYLTKPFEPYLGNKTKQALEEFQKDNSLPIGQLDFETLVKLGVIF